LRFPLGLPSGRERRGFAFGVRVGTLAAAA
jgi:hypothetical protein